MSFDNTIDFKDHIVQYPNRFKQTTVAPGVVELVPTWITNSNEIIESGTPVDSELFKKLKQNVTIYQQTFTTTENQTVINLNRDFLVGQNRVSLSIGGVRQYAGQDYTETDSHTLTMAVPLKGGLKAEVIMFTASQVIAEDFFEKTVEAIAATQAANDAAEAANEAATSTRLNWNTPVSVFSDIATSYPSPKLGDAVMVRDTGKVFRHDGSTWREIQDIDPFVINEVDDRLTSKLADIAINTRDFGTKGDGITDDSEAIKRAIANANGRTVVFGITAPAVSAVYRITKQIVIPNGVNIETKGNVKILRDFPYQNGYSMFLLQGDNLIDGLNFDGGSSSINVTGQEYTLYADLFLQGSNITIKNCEFDKSCGSSIVTGDYQNIKILFNTFRDYFDHAIYMGGRVNNADTNFIDISHNSFFSTIATREAVKVRNGVYNLQINMNMLNLPNATFFTCDVGDPSGDKANGHIRVSKNIGVCKTLLASVNQSNQITESVMVLENDVVCNGYIAQLNGYPSATGQNGVSIGCISFSNNNLSGQLPIVINGQLKNPANNLETSGISQFIFKGNTVIVKGPNSPVFVLIGKVKYLDIQDNYFKADYTFSSASSLISVAENNAYISSFKSPTQGNLFLKDNKIDGSFYALIQENSTGKTLSLVNWNVYAEKNKFLSANNVKIANVIGSYQSTLTTTLYLKDNLALASMMLASDWNASKISSQDMKPIWNKIVSYPGSTLQGVTPVNIDIPFLNVTPNDRVVVNAKYGLNSVIVMKAWVSTDLVRIQLYNASNASVTIPPLEFLLSIIKNDAGTIIN